MAIKGSNIEDLFREGLANHEMPVSSKVWAGVQTSIAGSTGAAAAGGSSLAMSLWSAAIGVALTSIAVVGEIQYQNQEANEHTPEVVEHVIPVSDEDDSTTDTITRDEAKRVIAEIEAAPEFVQVELVKNEIAESLDLERANENLSEIAETSEQEISMEVENKTSESQPEVKPSNDEVAIAADDDGEPEANKMDQETETSLNTDTPDTSEEQEEAVSAVDLGIPEGESITITPDGSGPHRCFELPYASNIAEFHIQIFTRDGRMIYESKDASFSWCGEDKRGRQLEGAQTVFFIINAFDYDGIQYKGPKAKSFITVR